MGSFNVGCGISNLSIDEGDKIGFVIIKKSTPLYGSSNAMGHFSNLDYFMPVFPPVFGEYGDYGSMINIERSVTVEILEDKFGIPMNAIMDCISCSHNIYSDAGGIYKYYFKGDRSWQGWGVEPAVSFAKLGFIQRDDVDGREVFALGGFEIRQRFELMKDHPDIKLWYWSVVRSKTGEVLVPEFMSQSVDAIMDCFAKVSGICPGFTDESVESIKHLQSFSGMFFLKDVYEDVLSFMEENNDEYNLNFYKSMWDNLRKAGTTSKRTTGSFGRIPTMSMVIKDLTLFPDKYFNQLKRYGDTYEFNHIFTLPRVMLSLNRMLMPSLNGEQFGDNDIALRATEITQSILEKRMNRNR